MNYFTPIALALCISAGIITNPLSGQAAEMKVLTKKTGAPILPTMYGLFFEDINFGADGGLYAEMIKNRSFEFEHPLAG